MIASLLDREDYPTLRECTYLNQASLGLVGQPAFTAMSCFLQNVARHGNLHMSDSDEMAYLDGLRECAASLFNCAARQVAVLSGASEILGQLPFIVRPRTRSKILLVASDFPALTRPWLRLSSSGVCSICFVADEPARDLTDSLIEAIDEHTSVVAVSSVQYASGTVVDIPRLRERASMAGARLIVDATQAAGAVPVDCSKWSADCVVSSGYKWLGAHGGVALGVVSPELMQGKPPMTGWMGAPNPFDFDARSVAFADDARRYTQSTMSYVSVAGLRVALEQLLAAGAQHIDMHARELAERLVASVAVHGWRPFRSLHDPAAAAHIISLIHPDCSTQHATAALWDSNIICSGRGGRIRVSIAPYNDASDIDAFVEAITRIT